MKIPHCQIREEISFEAKMARDFLWQHAARFADRALIELAIKIAKQRTDRDHRPHVTRPTFVRLRVCLTVFAHEGDSISTMGKSK
jgi:hypothetical protein